jgi:hypothetical protein
VAILLPLRISQEQGVRKETKDNGGFETEHQGRSGSNIALGLTQLLTDMSTRNISWGVKAAGA